MRKSILIMAVAIALLGTMAYAELQNVEVGGKIRIRANWLDFDDFGEQSFIEQRTRLNVKADFTDEVTAFIELDSYDIWGEDFRSVDYITGVDARAASGDDVEVYQAYIEAREMWGTPLRLRVGRQEITLGSGWLVGTNDKRYSFTGLSWDAARLSYVTDTITVDAIAAKLAESFSDFGEDDIDF
ncbi:MAG TPA: alginate export family protein, partial [Candidatus Hydrogenedens sp.]|nr:alginate export family protein [Candidatus Hydrogenedens sp.]